MSTATSTTYNYKVVRQFAIMTVIWGIVGMLVGVVIAAQLAFPELNLGLPWTSFGRLRPLHTNAVIFAFGGCALFATSYYSVQRTCQTRLFGGKLAAFDPVTNLRVGVKVLQECIAKGGSLEAGLRFYVGAANADDDNGYAGKVMAEHARLQQVASGRPVPLTAPTVVPVVAPAQPADTSSERVAALSRS